jgi:hypothetical protein
MSGAPLQGAVEEEAAPMPGSSRSLLQTTILRGLFHQREKDGQPERQETSRGHQVSPSRMGEVNPSAAIGFKLGIIDGGHIEALQTESPQDESHTATTGFIFDRRSAN